MNRFGFKHNFLNIMSQSESLKNGDPFGEADTTLQDDL